ncbi:MAG: long-chain fatty acid--CoA ligase [Acidiferrobacterales bacterium]|nr:long-chain fatty acid--CoA ligase [Acidiferrobacterales bacterium]
MTQQSASVYPANALQADSGSLDVIDPSVFHSISELFIERIKRTPQADAYLEYVGDSWKTWSWSDVGGAMAQWRAAFESESLERGDRVAIRLKNSIEWILFDQGAMSSGHVVVPVYAEDRADNIAYIIEQTSSRLLLVESLEDWTTIEQGAETPLECLQRIVVLNGKLPDSISDSRIISLSGWLAGGSEEPVAQKTVYDPGPDALATIVFTSGTTGKPKGVKLSHQNILSNAFAGLHSVAVYPTDRMLSFLPLSHMFERTIGCYLNVMAGSSVAFNRSIPELLDDMAMVKPTILITVPRIFERAYSAIKTQLDEGSSMKRWLFERAVEWGWQKFEHAQGRDTWKVSQLLVPVLDKLVGSKVRGRFGGNLRFVISGGAPLAGRISRVFVGLGIDILQGYGLTESSPVLTVNTLEKNKPDSIGLPLTGTQIRVAENGELQAKGSGVMQGYWQNPEASSETITDDGWLMTGDVASISDAGFISITGRIKEIIVLATGEKVPPSDMEAAICDDPLFEQAMVVGEGRSYLSAIIVIDQPSWDRIAVAEGFQNSTKEDFGAENVCSWVTKRVANLVEDFPGYANIYKVSLTLDPWTVDEGILTPTMKVKRPVIRQLFAAEIERMYEGH